MKGVILAAGDGTRLDPLTRHTPKPLVAVAGCPIVTYGLHALIEAGVTELIIVVGHLSDQIRHALGGTCYRSARLIYVESPDRYDGNGLSLYAAREAVGEEPFILTMADHLISPRLVRRLLATQPTQDTLCVDRQPSPIVQVDEATQVWVDLTGRIERIGKNLPRWNGLDTGTFWLTPAIFEAVKTLCATGVSAPTVTQACRWLIEDGSGLRACDVSGLFWTDVDTPADLRRAERVLRTRSRSLFQPALYGEA
ncbi:MAG: sugar phosphate nucleotidyltransferase [Anaerolineae bacterium]